MQGGGGEVAVVVRWRWFVSGVRHKGYDNVGRIVYTLGAMVWVLCGEKEFVPL